MREVCDSMPKSDRQTSETPSAGRRALRTALWQSGLGLALTAGLVAAVDGGARLLGPPLIVLSSFAGLKALRDWWRHLDEEWFAAEIALVSAGWVLIAAAFATIQFVAFSVAPSAFYVDVDYARLVSPRYRLEWARDSARTAAALGDVEGAAQALGTGALRWLVLDSVYALGGGATGQLVEHCTVQLPLERCPWQVVVVLSPRRKPIEIPVTASESDRERLSGAELQRQLSGELARLRRELADYGRRLADPAAFVQPRIVDFLYDTGVAFSGNDAGVFVPISALARICKIVEFLASLLLFGIVVSRVSAAAGERVSRRRR